MKREVGGIAHDSRLRDIQTMEGGKHLLSPAHGPRFGLFGFFPFFFFHTDALGPLLVFVQRDTKENGDYIQPRRTPEDMFM